MGVGKVRDSARPAAKGAVWRDQLAAMAAALRAGLSV